MSAEIYVVEFSTPSVYFSNDKNDGDLEREGMWLVGFLSGFGNRKFVDFI